MLFCHASNYKQENRKLGSAFVVWLLTTLSHSLYIAYCILKDQITYVIQNDLWHISLNGKLEL